MDEFPTCVDGLQSGELSLDQVSTIAERAVAGSDDHYRELARHATVAQLRTALRLAPKPKDAPEVAPGRSVRRITEAEFAEWRIKLPHLDAADTVLDNGSVAQRPTESPPVVAPYHGPTGERADWKWYEPFQPGDPPRHNERSPPPRAPPARSSGHAGARPARTVVRVAISR